MKARHLVPCAALAFFAAVLPAPAQSPPAIQNVAVMTCNLRTPKPVDSEHGDGWDSRKQFCIETIRKQHPDIIGFQECTKTQYDDLHAAFPDYATYCANAETALANDPYEVIFVGPRFTVVTSAAYWLSETPWIPGSKSWDNSKHARVINWMRIQDKASGVQLRILNTHFDQKGQVAREESARLAVSDAQGFPADFPQIFTGDLNAQGNNPAVAVLKDGGWIDSWSALHGPDDPGFTAHDFLGDKFVAKDPKKDHDGKIDWIFYRGNVQPLSSSIVCDSLNGHWPSDHFFVVAVFKVWTAAPPASPVPAPAP